MRLLVDPVIQTYPRGTLVQLQFDNTDAVEVTQTFGRLRPEVEYDIEMRERAKRSLSANAYHWALVEKIAQANSISKYEVHNHLMIDYGTDWLDEDGKHVYVLMKDNDSYIRKETEHYRPTDAVEDRKGTMYRWFVLLKPSHLMTKQEMTALITGTEQEAEALDIPIKGADEKEKMLDKWGD